ncbi:hypothetical protein AURDEDRAFT_180696 [Auricularia subglabra TFB-10046 SS5]|nr:hypothetical protein AURDEDRAFT_180696 [Auricularia subglabra TFB-10046 SS5]
MRISHPHLAHKRAPAPAPQKDDDDDDDDEPVKPTRSRVTRTRTTTTRTTVTRTRATRTTASTTTPRTRSRATVSRSTTTTPAVRTPASRSTADRATTPPVTPTTPGAKGLVGTPGAASATQSPDPSGTPLPEGSTSNAITGIAAAVAAIIGLAIALWFVRKWFMKRRAAKTNQWRASVHDQFDEKRAYADRDAAASEKDAASLRPLMAPGTPVVESFAPPALPPPAGIPDSMNRPSSVGSAAFSAPPVAPQSPSIMAMNTAVGPIAAASSPLSPAGARREAAMVIRPFMPTLADELPVTTGETVFIVEAFDDGWASCSNSRGQCGVVPLECLQSMARKPRDQLLAQQQQQQGGDWRTSKRVSSLYGGVRASGTY